MLLFVFIWGADTFTFCIISTSRSLFLSTCVIFHFHYQFQFHYNELYNLTETDKLGLWTDSSKVQPHLGVLLSFCLIFCLVLLSYKTAAYKTKLVAN